MRFDKVSFQQWYSDLPFGGKVDEVTARRWYENIKLPKQGTASSMGVDFFMPYSVTINPRTKIKVPTGIKWECSEEFRGFFGLLIVPRSSMGRKGLRLLNTICVCDADYSDAENEGHILLFMENTSDEAIQIPAGKGFVQGIVTGYTIPEGAESNDARTGGFGSTDKKGE